MVEGGGGRAEGDAGGVIWLVHVGRVGVWGRGVGRGYTRWMRLLWDQWEPGSGVDCDVELRLCARRRFSKLPGTMVCRDVWDPGFQS